MSEHPPHIVNARDAEAHESLDGAHWGQYYTPLTPALDALPGRLGANLTRVPPGRSSCPFHAHQLEDEIFYVLSGRGVVRYGDRIDDVGPGDCIACPAGLGIAHQFANPYDEDLVFLAVGRNDPNEVCTYPDSGKVNVRSLNTVGYLNGAGYMDGEPERPRIFDLLESAGRQD